MVCTNLASSVRKNPTMYREALASNLAALIAMKAEMLIILYSASKNLFLGFRWTILSMITACGLLIIMISLKERNALSLSPQKNPIDIISVLKLSGLILVMLAAVNLASFYLGNEAIMLVSFLSGLFEAHGITLANALLYSDGKVEMIVAEKAI